MDSWIQKQMQINKVCWLNWPLPVNPLQVKKTNKQTQKTTSDVSTLSQHWTSRSTTHYKWRHTPGGVLWCSHSRSSYIRNSLNTISDNSIVPLCCAELDSEENLIFKRLCLELSWLLKQQLRSDIRPRWNVPKAFIVAVSFRWHF